MHWISRALLAILLLSTIACNQAIEEGKQNELQPIRSKAGAETIQSLDVVSDDPGDVKRQTKPADVIAKHRQKVMALPEVKGMALGTCPKMPDVNCIVIYSTSKSWPAGLPKQLDGYTLVVKEVSTDFRPQ